MVGGVIWLDWSRREAQTPPPLRSTDTGARLSRLSSADFRRMASRLSDTWPFFTALISCTGQHNTQSARRLPRQQGPHTPHRRRRRRSQEPWGGARRSRWPWPSLELQQAGSEAGPGAPRQEPPVQKLHLLFFTSRSFTPPNKTSSLFRQVSPFKIKQLLTFQRNLHVWSI